MPNWIVKYWVQWLFGILGVALTSGTTWIVARIWHNKKLDTIKTRMDGMEQQLANLVAASLASQYDRLYYLHSRFIKEGWVSVADLHNSRGIYDGYHALGGNGTGTKLFEDLCKLPNFEPEGKHD